MILGLVVCSVLVVVDGAPLPFELVDMSHTFDNATLRWPNAKEFRLNVTQKGQAERGYWVQQDEFSTGIHVGTHVDAPCHFARGVICADAIPLDRLWGDAAVVDMEARAELDPDAELRVEEMQEWERLSGRSLNGTIVVVRSGWGRKWANRTQYFGNAGEDDVATDLHFPGISPDAARWLVSRRDVKGVMVETPSTDHGPSTDFATHRHLAEAGMYAVENVANVHLIPLVGATVHVMPMKIADASGAPARVIAMYPKVVFKSSSDSRSLREIIIFSR